ncbi:MAG: VTT domain-containing protein, partial [Burkholderiales bacterium]|nr:VTT domain-containing protein [Burkholderiales bacterium]
GPGVPGRGALRGAGGGCGAGRALGRPSVARRRPAPARARLDEWTAETGALALLTGRLIPVIAFNLINYAASLTPVSWWTFLWTTGLGILPFTIALCTFGEEMLHAPGWAWALLVAVAVPAWMLVSRYRRRRAARR